MGARTAFAAVFTCLLAGMAGAREPKVADLESFDVPGYTILAPDAGRARQVANWLGEAQVLLSVLLTHEAKPPTTNTTVWLLPSDDINRCLGGTHALLARTPQSFSSVIFLPRAEHDSRLRAQAYHQATHLFMRTQYQAEIPFWFEEGLAIFLETAEIDGNSAEVGHKRFSFEPPEKDTELLARFQEDIYRRVRGVDNRWFDLETVLNASASSPEFVETSERYFLRRQFWLFVYKALMDDAYFRSHTFDYLLAVNSFMPIDAAIEKSYGMKVPELEDALSGYARRDAFTPTKLTISPPAPVEPGAGTRVPAADLLERLAQLMFDTGSVDRIDEVIATATKQGLGPTRVRLLQLRAAARRQQPGFDRLLADLEALSNQPAVARAMGLALYERGQELERALPLLGRALSAAPADAQVAWTYGAIAVKLTRDVDAALAHLAAARRVHPDNADLAAMTAVLSYMKNDDDSMMRALQETLRLSRQPEQRRWAARQISQHSAKP